MNADVFEEHYRDIMNKQLSIEIRGESILISHHENGITRTNTINKSVYLRDVSSTRYNQRLSVNSVFIQNRLNCFVEEGVLYLDQDIPFSTQMHALDEVKDFFYIFYSKISYDGPLKLTERIFHGGKLVKGTNTPNAETSLNLIMKMKLMKLDPYFKSYVEKRLDKIYETPEERIKEYVDLTKPIEDISSFSVADELAKLNNQITILVEASNYISRIEAEKAHKLDKNTSSIDNKTRSVFMTQIDKAYTEHFELVRTNAILEVEEQEHRKLEEMAKEFSAKIDAIYKLLNDYYAKNVAAYELVYSDECSYELIIARIDSIYTFYGMANPYTNTIKEYKSKIRKALDKQEDSSKLVEEYKAFIEKASRESEDKAFQACVDYWKQHQNKIMIGSNPILFEIGSQVESFNTTIQTTLNYQKTKYPKGEYEKLEQQIRARYEEEYQDIIERISSIYYSKNNLNSMVKINKDEEYQKQLLRLKVLISQIKRDLKYTQRQDSIKNLLKNDMTNRTEDDEEFTTVFAQVEVAYNEMKKLEQYATRKGLFNLSVILNHYEANKKEYQAILERIREYFQGENNPKEYQSIQEALQQLTDKTIIICENEAKLLGQYEDITKQKKMM